ncbi:MULTISPECIES: hypothetical protein [Haloarcula]|uniref:hypothetical protein n=1 Tax=Haloarcula TaxID=2237 RepID=UPI0023E8AB71|nr:hypothetical protein [Halomicroarcula sp. SHR3]
MSDRSLREIRAFLGQLELGDQIWWATTSKRRQDAPSRVTGISRDDEDWRVKIRGPGGGRYWLVVESDSARVFHGGSPDGAGTSAGPLTEFGRLVVRPVEN